MMRNPKRRRGEARRWEVQRVECSECIQQYSRYIDTLHCGVERERESHTTPKRATRPTSCLRLAVVPSLKPGKNQNSSPTNRMVRAIYNEYSLTIPDGRRTVPQQFPASSKVTLHRLGLRYLLLKD